LSSAITDLTKRKYEVIKIARDIGISKTAEIFNLSPKSIRSWKKRFTEGGLEGLQNKSRTAQYHPNRMTSEVVKQIITLKTKHPEYSIPKIIKLLNLSCSPNIIYKKIRQLLPELEHNNYKKSENKNSRQKNIQDASFSHFFVSIKKVGNIQKKKGYEASPLYLMMIEEQQSGLSFCSFTYERTSLSMAIFLQFFLEILIFCKLERGNKIHVYLCCSICLSENNILHELIVKKFNVNIITGTSRIEFFSPPGNKNPLTYLKDSIFFDKHIEANEESIILRSYSALVSYNLHILSEYGNAKKMQNLTELLRGREQNQLLKKITGLLYTALPFLSDQFTSNLTEMKQDKLFFTSSLTEDAAQQRPQHVAKRLTHSLKQFVQNGQNAEARYDNDYAEEQYISGYISSKHHAFDSPLFPENSSTQRIMGSYLLESLIGLSRIYRLKGEVKQEIECLQQALKLSERFGSINNRIDLQNQLVSTYLAAGQNDQANIMITKISCLKNKTEEQLLTNELNWARLQAGEGKLNKAEDKFTEILKLTKQTNPLLAIPALLGLGKIKSNKGYFTEAANLYSDAQELANKSLVDRYDIILNGLLGIHYGNKNDFDTSLQYLHRALKLAEIRGDIPARLNIVANIGNIYHLNGKFNKALEHFLQVLELSPKTGQRDSQLLAMLNISYVYFHIEKYNSSEKYIEEVIILAQKNHNIKFYHEGILLKTSLNLRKRNYRKAATLYSICRKEMDKIQYSHMSNNLELLGYETTFYSQILDTKNYGELAKANQDNLNTLFLNLDLAIKKEDKTTKQRADLCFLFCKLYNELLNINQAKHDAKLISKMDSFYKLYLAEVQDSYAVFLQQNSNCEYEMKIKDLNKMKKV